MKDMKDGYRMHRGFAVGKEITDFARGSWQEAEHERGRRFFESVAPAPRAPQVETIAERVTAESQLGTIALSKEVAVTPNHQEIATVEDKLQEMHAVYPEDTRHLVAVDAA